MGTLPLPEIVFLWLSTWLVAHLLPSVILLLIVPNLSFIFLSLALSAYCISLSDIPYVLLTFYCFFLPPRMSLHSESRCLFHNRVFLLVDCGCLSPAKMFLHMDSGWPCPTKLLLHVVGGFFFYYFGNSIVLLLRKEPPYLVYY